MASSAHILRLPRRADGFYGSILKVIVFYLDINKYQIPGIQLIMVIFSEQYNIWLGGGVLKTTPPRPAYIPWRAEKHSLLPLFLIA